MSQKISFTTEKQNSNEIIQHSQTQHQIHTNEQQQMQHKLQVMKAKFKMQQLLMQKQLQFIQSTKENNDTLFIDNEYKSKMIQELQQYQTKFNQIQQENRQLKEEMHGLKFKQNEISQKNEELQLLLLHQNETIKTKNSEIENHIRIQQKAKKEAQNKAYLKQIDDDYQQLDFSPQIEKKKDNNTKKGYKCSTNICQGLGYS